MYVPSRRRFNMDKLLAFLSRKGKVVKYRNLGNMAYQENGNTIVLDTNLSDDDADMLADLLGGGCGNDL